MEEGTPDRHLSGDGEDHTAALGPGPVATRHQDRDQDLSYLHAAAAQDRYLAHLLDLARQSVDVEGHTLARHLPHQRVEEQDLTAAVHPDPFLLRGGAQEIRQAHQESAPDLFQDLRREVEARHLEEEEVGVPDPRLQGREDTNLHHESVQEEA